MPSTPAHNARQVAVSGWKACSNLSFKWCIVLDLVGLALLVTGLTLISLGFSPSETRRGRLGEVPVDSGNKGMQISGLIILPIGVICFFTGLALTVKSVRSVPERVLRPVSVQVRPPPPSVQGQGQIQIMHPNRQTVQTVNHKVVVQGQQYAGNTGGYPAEREGSIYSQLPTRVSAPRLSTATSASSDVFYIEQYDVTPRRNVPPPPPQLQTSSAYTHNPYYSRGRMYAIDQDYEEPPPPFNPNYRNANRQRY